MLDTLKALCALPGVSGMEDAVRAYIRRRAERCADSVKEDVMGNLIVTKRGTKRSGRKLMLAAHMDEVGLMITDITREGYLKFGCVGSIDRRILLGKSVKVGPNLRPGLIGLKAIHLVPKSERDTVPQVQDMYIDVGASSREEAEKLVRLGDTAVFDETAFTFGRMVKAKAIDDRLGCTVLLHLLESELPVDCTFVFTVQEEVGTRGALAAAFRVKPDVALIVEGTTAADLPSVKTNKRICAPGEGVVIPFMDRGTIYDRELYALLTELAERNGIPWQTKTYIAGGTDAAAVQRSVGGVQTAGIAAAVRNIHSPACVAAVDDLQQVYALAYLFLQEMGARYGSL